MRSVSQAWGALNAARVKDRRFYIRIETTPGVETGDVYICSHEDITITTDGVVLLAKPKSHPKIRTQTLNPDEGRSTIGTMSFDAIDVDQSLTDEMRTALLTNDVGWRQKRVQYYSGFAGLALDDYELEDTQLIDRVTYSQGVYQFRCRDIQREMRKSIFEPLVARLAQPLTADATTIEIFADPGFEAVEHGTSYSDAASSTVLYVQIDDEIIRVPAAGINPTSLTSCVRGVLGTRAEAHTTDETASAARGKEVREVIYLELPVPKLVYALLTGNLIGQTGTLPAHWHLGIDAGDYVRLADFTDIGADLYVQSDDTLGMIERHIITDSEDGKQFIERDVLRKYGLFMPIGSDGAIGLRRGQPVLSGSAVVGMIDDSMIVDEVTLTYAMDKVINEFSIGWNEVDGEPTRFLSIVDSESITRWGTAPRMDITARGLVGSRQTSSRVLDIFEGLRDRYSGPPLTCEVTVFGSQALYEVGDVIRLTTSHVRDFTNSSTTLLDRAFEIQGISKSLSAGTVTYTLFGSSQKAGSLPPLETTAALDDAFYSGAGTNIATLPGVVDAGTELVLPDGMTFTGAATVAGAVFYALKDVRIPSGDVVTYTDNVQLRVKGTLQIDGDLDGSGGGLAGVSDTIDLSSLPLFVDGGPNDPVEIATQAGTPGYFGVTQAAGALYERTRQKDSSPNSYRVVLQSVPATITRGSVEAIPSLNLICDGSSIAGVPADLRGTSGGPGGFRHWSDTRNDPDVININRGGDGGAGGAGLLIICRGMVFGASGRIVSSGADGVVGVTNPADERPGWSGGGAGGAPGATIILLDGASSPSPVLTSGTIVADYGTTPEPGGTYNYLSEAWITVGDTRFASDAAVPADRISFFKSSSSGLQAGIAAARFFFLLPPTTAEENPSDDELANLQDISIVVSESFEAVEDARLTVIIVDVTEVSVTDAYSHAAIYTKRTTGDDPDPAFIYRGGADPRLRIVLPADGETYTIRAVPVLINGVEATTGVEETQIVSTPGLNRLSASVSYNRANIWRRAPNAGAWTPVETTVDGTVEFIDTTGVVASRTVRATLDGSAGTITVNAGHATSGQATTPTTSGSGTASLAVTVEHDATGIKAVLNFAAVQSGSDGTSVTILGTLADVGDLPDPGLVVGDAYIIDGDLWVWDGATWNNVGPIVGPPGSDGLSIADVMVYKRSGSAPSTPTGGSYDFDTKTLTPPTGWSVGVPAGTDPVYVSRSTAYIIGQSGSYSSFTWTAPVLAFQNGVDGLDGDAVDIVFKRSAAQPTTPAPSAGTPATWYTDVDSVPASSDPLWSSVGTRPDSTSNWTWQAAIRVEGAPGLSVAELSIYRRSPSAPSTPTGGTYTFGTDTMNSIPAGWTRTVPSGTDPVYVSRAVASINGASGTSGTLTWSTPVISFQNGATGATGATGDAVDIIFKRSSGQPATPSPSGGTPATWYSDVASVPAGADPIWSSVGQKASGSGTYTWDTPVRLQGQDGSAGLSVAEISIYRRAAIAPSTPTGGTYTFGTDTLNSTPSGWTRGVPTGTDPVYVSRSVASISGPSGTSGTLTWSAPVKSFQNGADGAAGADGAPGDAVDIIFKRAAVQPSAPAPSTGTPAGWFSSVASVPPSSDPMWSSVGKKASGQTNYSWETPLRVEGEPGTDGTDGLSIAELIIYIRSATDPAAPSGGSYTFESDTINSIPAGWTRSIPVGTDPVYTSRAVASIVGATGTDSSLSWSAPVVSFQNGEQGAAGDAVDIIFRRSAAQPSTPAPSAGVPVDWYSDVASVPAGVNPIWSSVGQKGGAESDYTWDTPVKLEGQDGATGDPGLSVAELVIYRRSSGAPATPNGGTYTFSNDTINSLPSGWSRSIPSGTLPVYTSRAVASVAGTGTTGTLTWSAPVLSMQNGDQGEPGDAVDIIFKRSASQPATPSPSAGVPATWYSAVASVPPGSDLMWSCVGKRASGATNYTWETPVQLEGQQGAAGSNGLSVAELSIYRRAAVAPSTPVGGTYTFQTDTINSLPSGWTRGIPVGTDPVYVSRTVASISGPSGTSGTLSWSSPVVSLQNGATGQAGDSVDVVFQRAGSQPGIPAPSPGVPVGWYTDVDSVPVTADPLWSSVGTKAGGASNYTWMLPVRIEGVDGDPGNDGISVAEISIYRRSDIALSTPVGGAYTFDTDTLSSIPAGWSRSVPSGTNPCYVSRTVASIVGQSGTDGSLTWSAPVVSFQNGSQGDAGDSIDVIFRRSAAQPVTPSPSVGTPTSWYSNVNSVPAGSDPIWSSFGTRAGGQTLYTWQTPVKIEGQDGPTGSSGLSVAELSIYRRSSGAPLTPTGGSYTFESDTLNSTPSGWSRSIPAGTDPLYVSRTVASISGPAGTDATLTWSTPVLSMMNGADGANGLSVAELTIYRRAAVPPSTPTGGSFDFNTQTLTPPASWSASIPSGTDPVYASKGVASVIGQTGTDNSITWTAPAKALQDGANGADGADGQGVDIVFKRAAAQPATPAPSAGVPATWYTDVDSVPAGSDPLWSSIGTRATSISDWVWQTPVKIEGADGADGMDAIGLAYNPTFEQGAYGWDSHASIVIAEDAATARTGSWRASRTSTGDAVRINSRKVPTKAGARFAVSGWVRSSVGAAYTSIQWQCRFYNSSDVYLSALTGTYDGPATTEYQFVSAFGAAPATASYAVLSLRVVNQTAGTVYWDEGQLLDISSIAVNVLLGGIFSDFIELATTGKIYSGKTTFDTAAAGFFLGLDGGVPKFRIGNAAGTQQLSWDGTNLTVDGSIIQSGNLVDGAATDTYYNRYVGSPVFPAQNVWADVLSISNIVVPPISASPIRLMISWWVEETSWNSGTTRHQIRLVRTLTSPAGTASGTVFDKQYYAYSPINSWFCVDDVSAGTYTYTVQFNRLTYENNSFSDCAMKIETIKK